jgi:chaperonin GroEL
MAKDILFGEDVANKLRLGAKILHDAVAISLSPRGRNVGIDLGFEALIHHDGVEIARQVDLSDAAENFAVKILRQAANKQLQTVGDGTTATIILSYAIYKECLKQISAGVNPRSLESGLIQARDLLLTELERLAIPIKTKEQAIQIAQVSSQDLELGKLIGETIFKLGKDGVVTTDESPTGKTFVEIQEGMQFENGFISPIFITDPTRLEATVENAKILLSDQVLDDIYALLPFFNEMLAQNQRNLVIIAQDVSGSMLPSLIINKLKGQMNVIAIKAPYSGQTQRDFLDDIAILTGATVIGSSEGRTLKNVSIGDLGNATRVTSTERATMIVGGKGEKTEITARVESLKALMDRQDGSDYQREKIKERFAKLGSGIAVIKVGGSTEVEIKNWTERAKDAIEATQAAMQEGFVAGGEIIYLTIREVLRLTNSRSSDVMYKALEQPFSILMTNAGYKPDMYLEKVTDKLGVDVLDGKVKNMIEEGIIDPVLAISESLKNSISVATQLMTTEVLILQKEEKK